MIDPCRRTSAVRFGAEKSAVVAGRLVVASLLTVSAVFIAACDGIDRNESDNFSLHAPTRIRSIQAIDQSSLTATATVNGVELILTPAGGGTFGGNVSVPANSTVPVTIVFSENVNGEALVLATQTQQVSTGAGNSEVRLRRAAYTFDAHDADGDSVNNITEREENTNPFDASDAPPMVNVSVVATQPEDAANAIGDKFSVEASVGSSVQVLQPAGNEFRGSFYTVNRAPITATTNIIEKVTGQQLTVASQSLELATLFDQQTISFNGENYQLTDRDGDNISDVAELVAGTDIQSSNNQGSSNFVFSTEFDIPESIQNPASVYAELRVDGESVGLSRNSNTYTASTNATAGAIVVLDVLLKDNFNGTAYIVAQAQKTVQIAGNQQAIQFATTEFNLQLDTDSDGVLNYIEREQGTDPGSAADGSSNPDPDNGDNNPDPDSGDNDPDPDSGDNNPDPDDGNDNPDPDDGNDNPDPDDGSSVSCVVDDLPTQTVAAGSTVTQSVAGFLDCGDAAITLDAAEFQFFWSGIDGNIQWVVPQTAAAGTAISYTVDVLNPQNPFDLYASFQVNATVAANPDVDSCTAEPTQTVLPVTRDVHVQGTEVFNEVLLRVDNSNRSILLGFNAPASASLTGNATLTIDVANDEGDGTISVAQLEGFGWSESDSALQIPVGGQVLGSLDGNWLIGQKYQFDLTGLKQNDNGELTLVVKQLSGNDTSIWARESGLPATLTIEAAGVCTDQ